jgi:hypothetical protein
MAQPFTPLDPRAWITYRKKKIVIIQVKVKMVHTRTAEILHPSMSGFTWITSGMVLLHA